MTDDRPTQHDLDVLRDEHAHERFALRRLERRSVAEERALERRLSELSRQHERAARRLESEYRRTHFGKPFEAWPARGRDGH
jgi:hypothetical protein